MRRHSSRREAISTYRYPEGWYQEGQARMYVNRGVGFTWLFRLNCPPEIACFTLRSDRAEGIRPLNGRSELGR